MNQVNIWSHYQTNATEVFRGSGFRLYYLAKFIRNGQHVLNVGIGGGVFERFANERGAVVHTLDPDWLSLSDHATTGISRLVAGKLEKLPFADNVFDAVVVSEVLEHLAPDEMRLALAEIRRVLVQRGKIIGTVPCEENLTDATVVCPHCGEVFHKVGHLQSFTAATMTRELQGFFEPVRCYERAFMAKAQVGWKELLVDLVRNLLVTSGVLTREKQLVFLGTKR